ncbi:wall-associated receptor kinase 2-like [Papaver somniferum]|uniref:wall-associated receptor kinase 2-like n=1 Tax=Papaver somniferum TaxID=3469 RepID=UPI000E70200F|nr:wall-associated receptor kinase 2-like [Papaver somniferum]
MVASHVLVKFQCFIFLLQWLQVTSAETPPNAYRPITKPGCQDRCGNVSIPYPFGIGEGCFIGDYFGLTCSNDTFYFSKPMTGTFTISDISISDGEFTTGVILATDCSDKKIKTYTASAHLNKFTFSNTKNKFIAIGCDTWAYLGRGDKGNIGTGCMSVCKTMNDITTDGSCSGIGCCKASIPSGLSLYNASVRSMDETRMNLTFNPCSYAFLVKESWFQFNSSYLKDFQDNGAIQVPVVVDWTIGYAATCNEAKRNQTSYACGLNSDCITSTNAPGYRCICKKGYEGNPYLNSSTGGECQDIDECNAKRDLDERCESERNICINTEGGYRCPCKQGFVSQNEKNGISECIPRQRNSNKTVVDVCIGLIFLVVILVASFWLSWGYRKRKHMQIKEEFFKQNGGLILNRLLDEREEDIESSRNGRGGKKHRSIATIYTEKELSKATNNYHDSNILGRGGFGTVYKGVLSNGTVVAIKKTKIVDRNQNEQFINEIAVLSQINHKNVVQLLGCCLESEVPLLVYEFVTNGTLHQHLHEGPENQTGSATLSWENRLRIALEVAGSLAYLHAEASIPIIHRDIKSSNVLLDEDYKAKVADFGASRLNPTDQAQLSTVVQGTFGYLDPEYMLSNQLTVKSDVYSFGVLLVELLTSKAVFSPDRAEEERNLANYFLSSMKTNRLFVILDGNLARYDNERVSSVDVHQQIQQMAELAQKCLRMKGENRPTMKEVAMALHGLMMISSSQPGVLDDDYMFTNTTKEERMLLAESAKLLSYTDSITTIGDSSMGVLASQNEGR